MKELLLTYKQPTVKELEETLAEKESWYSSLPPIEAHSPIGCYVFDEIERIKKAIEYLKS